MEELKVLLESAFDKQTKKEHFDHWSLGLIDFQKGEFQTLSSHQDPLFFDLASLTKPLTLSISFFLFPEAFDSKMKLLLNHQGGFPPWKRLESEEDLERLLDFEVIESPPLYSDLSALRLMKELEKKEIHWSESSQLYDSELLFWQDLKGRPCAPTGMRGDQVIQAEVHDNNAWRLKGKCTHAGLFSTVSGLCQTLLNMERDLSFLKKLQSFGQIKEDHYTCGFEKGRPLGLSGASEGSQIYGHLGFTGVSFWVDCQKRQGQVLLTNESLFTWFDRSFLNDLRLKLGQRIWTNFERYFA